MNKKKIAIIISLALVLMAASAWIYFKVLLLKKETAAQRVIRHCGISKKDTRQKNFLRHWTPDLKMLLMKN